MSNDFALRIQAIIDTAIDGIITIDVHGVIETVNQAAIQMFGYAESDIVGKKINVLMPEPYKSSHDGYMSRYLSTKIPRIIGIGREVLGERADGSVFPFRLAVSEVILNDRIIFTGIIHDLTDVKAAEERILRLNEELESKVSKRTYELENVVNKLLDTNTKLEEEINERKSIEAKLMIREEELKLSLEKEKELGELKSRFVSMASHEFRTPLATILSSAALISRYEEHNHQPKRVKHVERIKSAVNNLTGILNDFLSISKLEEGKIDVKYDKVNLESLIELIKQEVEGIMKPGQAITVNFINTLRPVISDERIIKNILFNLVSNSIKYSYESGLIECNIKFLEEELEIEIKDKGIGIPLEDQKHMFERFFRAGNVTNIQGTGLGLNIVKRYVDILGGSIRFTSIFGEGSSFFVKLPYRSKQL
ncbi:MAG: PAS domain-containing sensor histidine kinase [Saprospiraceae bacterium]|nr:PAS domain-containing sensor histidine kinase [Bacteroidia bacterium]NNF36234.1 PAS domain-containing sensor histidine kinase [Saprospiraceae bacterium]